MSAERKPDVMKAILTAGASEVTRAVAAYRGAKATAENEASNISDAAIAVAAELIAAAREVESTERDYWNMPLCRNPERYAERHDEAKKRLYAALAAVRGGA